MSLASSPRTILLTGATGHIGSRLLPALLASDPRLLVRAATPDAPIKDARVEWVPADFRDADLDYHALTRGVSEVWHLGAATRHDDDAIMQVNAEATARLTQAAVSCGAERFLFTSTAFAYGYMRTQIVRDGQPIAHHPWYPSREKFAEYGLSKFRAERGIEAAARGAMQTVILRLCRVSSQDRADESIASYTAIQRRLWAARIWHVMEAGSATEKLVRLREADVWPQPGAIAYYNFSADSLKCRIGDILGTAPTSPLLRGPALAVIEATDRLRSWQRNGAHPGRYGLPHLVYSCELLSAAGLGPEPYRPAALQSPS